MKKNTNKKLIGSFAFLASVAVGAGIAWANPVTASADTIVGENATQETPANFFVDTVSVRVEDGVNAAGVRFKVRMAESVFDANLTTDGETVKTTVKTGLLLIPDALMDGVLNVSNAQKDIDTTNTWYKVEGTDYMECCVYVYDVVEENYGDDILVKAYALTDTTTTDYVYTTAAKASLAEVADKEYDLGTASELSETDRNSLRDTYCTYDVKYYLSATDTAPTVKTAYWGDKIGENANENAAIENPVKDGYTFCGWTNSAGTHTWDMAENVVTGDVNLYANLKKSSYFLVNPGTAFSDWWKIGGTVGTYGLDTATEIENADEATNAQVNGSMWKITLNNIQSWGNGWYTHFDTTLDTAFESFDYVDVKMYFDIPAEGFTGSITVSVDTKSSGNKPTGSAKVTLLSGVKTSGWYTVRINKASWSAVSGSATWLFVENLGTGGSDSSFVSYIDEITGGYNGISLRDSMDGPASNYTVATNMNVNTYTSSIVDTIDGATAEDQAKANGSMVKLGININGTSGSAMWSRLNATKMDALAAAYNKIHVRAYLDLGTSERATMGLYTVNGSTMGEQLQSLCSPTESGWIDFEIDASKWASNSYITFWNWGSTAISYNLYIDEIYGVDAKATSTVENVDILTKTGLTATELAGTYYENAEGVKTVLTAEELAAFNPAKEGKLVLIINVEGCMETQYTVVL